MGSTAISFIVLACVVGSALVGLSLRRVLPEHHLNDASLGVVKLATGLIATLSALVLGLLISSAKGSFDRVSNELVESAAKVVALDRVLADYGPDTGEIRAALKRDFAAKVELIASGDRGQLATFGTRESLGALERLQLQLWRLKPGDEAQQGLRARAVQIAAELASTRSLVMLQQDGSIPMPLLSVLVLWLIIIFASFGLCAPHNSTAVGALLVCALCASGAIFLILEMDQPLEGWIRIPVAPLRAAVAQLGL